MTSVEMVKEVVRQSVNEYDPEDLLTGGAPPDEYDPEIESITSAIIHRPIPTENELWIVVCNVLHWYFGDMSDPVLYWQKHRELASMIHMRLLLIERQVTAWDTGVTPISSKN